MDADLFFEFFADHSVKWWNIDIQPRLSNGDRGGKLGAIFQSAFPWPSHRCSAAAAALEARVIAAGKGKRGLDGICSESPSAAGRRVVLIDDLDELTVDSVFEWWNGAGAAIQTSPGNFQVFLISPDGLGDKHHLITSNLCRKFGGDPASTGSGQMHRYPGSKNYKLELIDAGLAPYVTQLHLLRTGSAELASRQLGVMLTSDSNTVPSGRPIARLRDRPKMKGADNSREAWAWTLENLVLRTPESEILLTLATRFIGHHSPHDWPQRTLENAKNFLAGNDRRFTSRLRSRGIN